MTTFVIFVLALNIIIIAFVISVMLKANKAADKRTIELLHIRRKRPQLPSKAKRKERK